MPVEVVGASTVDLRSVLRRFRGRVALNAEFKTEAVIAPAIELVRRYDAYDTVYFQATSRARYEAARAYDRRIGLQLSPNGQEELDWALTLADPNLLVIELHPNIRTDANIDRIHRRGMLVSENAWHFRDWLLNPREMLWAECFNAFAHRIEIAISENPVSCLAQRAALGRDLLVADSQSQPNPTP